VQQTSSHLATVIVSIAVKNALLSFIRLIVSAF
jgi:hypothetical protein